MFAHPRKKAGPCATGRASSTPTAFSTACRGTAADTLPDELSLLAEQATDFRKSARTLRAQCALEQARKFVAGHRVTTAVAVALAVAVVWFLSF